MDERGRLDEPPTTPAGDDRLWSRDRAWAWYEDQPWLCGVNYMASTAVNHVEMWQEESFRPDVIERELGWAADLGMTSVRIGLPHVVWQYDAAGLKRRLDRVLHMLDERSMTAMVHLLDDCEFSGEPPHIGPQSDPVPGLHNGRATGSPGRAVVTDPSAWSGVLEYVADLVLAFVDDARVAVWDLYNEPGNRVIFRHGGAEEYDEELEHHAEHLLYRVYDTARSVAPIQPLTCGGWRVPPPYEDDAIEAHVHPLDVAAFDVSDVISYHAYCSPDRMQRIIDRLRIRDRPILCTEWMGRHANSRIEDQLPMLRHEGVASYMWGFVAGRSQTYLPWSDFLEPSPEDEGSWFHDLVDQRGVPYDEDEVAVIRGELARARAGERRGR